MRAGGGRLFSAVRALASRLFSHVKVKVKVE